MLHEFGYDYELRICINIKIIIGNHFEKTS